AVTVGHGAAAQLVVGGESLREGAVGPLDERRLRTEVARELERLQPHGADAVRARREEQADLRIAEAVDGLHRIADDEQRAGVALLRRRGEGLEELELCKRGVLELVHQDMAQRESGAQRELRRMAGLGERLTRRTAHVGVVDPAAGGELRLQLTGRMRQYLR